MFSDSWFRDRGLGAFSEVSVRLGYIAMGVLIGVNLFLYGVI